MPNSSAAPIDLLHLYMSNGLIRLEANPWLIAAAVVLAALAYGWARRGSGMRAAEFEIDEAELGIGSHKLKLRPNRDTAQIAYKLWIEVSTRKIGLPIDFDNDVIVEVYDSWYAFFRVTRELLKEIPASQLRRNPSTERLVGLAIDILNEGLRPHLTTWQARFRRWHEREVARSDAEFVDPQEQQKNYPRYDDLRQDMQAVNEKLISYRGILHRIVFPL